MNSIVFLEINNPLHFVSYIVQLRELVKKFKAKIYFIKATQKTCQLGSLWKRGCFTLRASTVL